MTDAERKLRIIDLSARLPYHTQVKYRGAVLDLTVYNRSVKLEECIPYLRPMSTMNDDDMENYAKYKFQNDEIWEIVEYKRTGKGFINPMSSMSEDEKKSLEELCTMYNGGDNTDYESFGIEILQTHPRYGDAFRQNFTALDWLNSHHFDYRGLIEKGLALEAPEGMYKL